MKKSCFCFSLILFCCLTLFTGCSNFLQGSELKDSIEDQIKISAAKNTSVMISVINGKHGYIPQEGAKNIKIGIPFDISVKTDSNYIFERWVAFEVENDFINPYIRKTVSLENFEPIYEQVKKDVLSSDEVEFSDATSEETKVTVHTEKNIIIVPLFDKHISVVKCSFSQDKVYSCKSEIVFEFNKDLSPDILIPGLKINYYLRSEYDPIEKKHMSVYETKECTLLNPEYAYIVLKEAADFKNDSLALLYFHASIVDGNKLVLRPVSGAWYYDFSEEYKTLDQNENIPKSIRESIHKWLNEGFGTDLIKISSVGYFDDFLITNSYLKEQKVEITFTQNLKDSNGITAAVPYTYYWYRGNSELNDTYSPVILDAWALFKESARLGFAGGYKYDFTKYQHNKGFEESKNLLKPEMALGNDNDNDNDNIPKKVDVYLRHVKYSFDLYVKAIDNNDTVETDFGVSKIHYSIKRIGNPDGTKVSPYDGIYEKTLDYVTNSIEPLDSEVIKKARDNYLYLENLHEEKDGMWINIDVSDDSKYKDGLYYLELYAEDLSGNVGKTNPLTGVDYTFKNGESFSIKENVDYAKHVLQFYFYKDTNAPVVTSTVYTNNSAALMPKQSVFTSETVLPAEDINAKIIIDAGSEKYYKDSIGIFNADLFRYCEIKSSSTRSTNKWTVDPSQLKYEDWQKTSVDYKFDYENIIKTLPDGDCDIWIAHCDSVGNIAETVILSGALILDKNPPVVKNPSTYSDYDGKYCKFQMIENGIGLKKIYYSAKDTQGDDYPDINCLSTANSGLYIGNHYYYKDKDFTIDTENHVITLTVPYIDSGLSYIYLYPANFTEGTVILSLEDGVGNRSEEEIFNF